MGTYGPVLLFLGLQGSVLDFLSTVNNDLMVLGAMPSVEQKRFLHTSSLHLSAWCRWLNRDIVLLDATPPFFCFMVTFSIRVWIYSLCVSQEGMDQKLLKISVLSSSVSSSQLRFSDFKQCCDLQGGPMVFGGLSCPILFL